MKIRIEIDCSNAAFEEPNLEVQRILEDFSFSLRDLNGNTCGKVTVKKE